MEQRRDRIVELFAAGAWTPLAFALAWLLRRAVGASDAEYAAGFATFYAAFVINDPHFAVTYLLFYERAFERTTSRAILPAQRARYAFAAWIVPAAAGALCLAALRSGSPTPLGALVQLMYLFVGFHYAKQGFGVATILSARRGRPLEAGVRRALLVHAYAAWAFAWANPAAPAGEFEEKGVVYRALAHPAWLERAAGIAFVLTGVWGAVVIAGAVRRRPGSVPMVPLVAYASTLWCWTVFTTLDPVMRYLIPALHSVQYLYFVHLLRRNEARAAEGPPSFGRPPAVRLAALALGSLVLGALLLHLVPTFLDEALVRPGRAEAGDPLGQTPFLAAFFVFVNVHHYAMDFVIWRRDHRETRALLADCPEAGEGDTLQAPSSRAAPALR